MESSKPPRGTQIIRFFFLIQEYLNVTLTGPGPVIPHLLISDLLGGTGYMFTTESKWTSPSTASLVSSFFGFLAVRKYPRENPLFSCWTSPGLPSEFPGHRNTYLPLALNYLSLCCFLPNGNEQQVPEVLQKNRQETHFPEFHFCITEKIIVRKVTNFIILIIL